ncbi:unnamed protein product [Somion occarium]|uniref:DUF6533 domain-containing protein n=1 Tax=Somion occarium TaxID=3059160 RepID=A0ABP1DFP9_9APHY
MASMMDLNALFLFMSEDRTNRYLTVSAIVFLMYDIVLNFAREYKFVWRTRWGLVKTLYYIARYYALINIIFLLCGPVVFTTTINVIFILRIHALYGQSRKVLISLVLLVLAEFVLEMYTDISFVLHSQITQPIPGMPWMVCLAVATQDVIIKTLAAWIPNLLVTWIFFVMTLYKFAMLVRRNEYRSLKQSTSLMHVFVKDGTIYFFLTFCIVLICTVFVMVESLQAESGGPIIWLMAIYSLAGSRLILNLRSAAEDQKLSFGVSESEVSAMRAAPASGGTTQYVHSDIELEALPARTRKQGGNESSDRRRNRSYESTVVGSQV